MAISDPLALDAHDPSDYEFWSKQHAKDNKRSADEMKQIETQILPILYSHTGDCQIFLKMVVRKVYNIFSKNFQEFNLSYPLKPSGWK